MEKIVIKNAEQERLKNLTQRVLVLEGIVRSLEDSAKHKDAKIIEYKTLISHTQEIVEELLVKNHNLDNDMKEMVQTHTQLENEMIENASNLEKEFLELKRVAEPDNEVEQFAILLEGKNKSYARTVIGIAKKCDFQTNSIQQASKEQQDTHICAGKKSETNPLKTVECTVCDDKFSNKTELNSHKLKNS